MAQEKKVKSNKINWRKILAEWAHLRTTQESHQVCVYKEFTAKMRVWLEGLVQKCQLACQYIKLLFNRNKRRWWRHWWNVPLQSLAKHSQDIRARLRLMSKPKWREKREKWFPRVHWTGEMTRNEAKWSASNWQRHKHHVSATMSFRRSSIYEILGRTTATVDGKEENTQKITRFALFRDSFA